MDAIVIETRESVRRVDWRFLLDDPQLRSVLLLGSPVDAAIADSVRSVGGEVVDDIESTGAGGGPVVFAHDPGSADLERAIALGRAGARLVVQTTSRRARRAIGRRLRRTDLHVRQFGCWPTLADATRFVPLDDRTELLASAQSSKNRRRRAIALAITRLGAGAALFRHGLTIAQLDGSPAAVLRVASGDDATGSTTLLTPRFGSSRRVVALVTDDGGRSLVVKTSRAPDDDDQIERDVRGLASVPGPEPLRPTMVCDTTRFGQRWLVETRVAGVPLARRHVERDPDRWLEATARWLRQMPSGPATTPGDDGRHERLLQPALDTIARVAADERALRPLLADAEQAIARIRDARLPVIAEHGDFRPPNLIVAGPDSVGAVDWELAEPNGFPLHDLLFFHDWVAAIAPDSHGARRRIAIDELARLGVDGELHGPLATVASLRQLANLVDRGTVSLSDDPVVAASDVALAWTARLDRASDGGRR